MLRGLQEEDLIRCTGAALVHLNELAYLDDQAPPQDTWLQVLLDEHIVSADMLAPRGGAEVEQAYHTFCCLRTSFR